MIVTSLVKKKQLYEVIFDHQLLMILSENVVVDYRLVKGKSIDDEIFSNIKKSAETDYFYQLAMKQLKYQKTSHQIKAYLISKEATLEVASDIVERLKRMKMIDDDAYLNLYLTKKASIKQLRFELLQKGFDSQVVDEKLSAYDERSVLNLFAQSNLKKYHEKPEGRIKMYRYLVSKGFNYVDVKEVIDIYFKS